MKNKTTVIVETVPHQHWQFACRRTAPLLDWWGRFLDVFTIQQLAASCYQQGMIDTLKYLESKKQPEYLPDYAI